MFQTAIFETEFSGPRLKNLNLDMTVCNKNPGELGSKGSVPRPSTFWVEINDCF